MAWRWLIFAVLCLHLRAVLSSTLYQWIVDSQTRFNYDPDRTNRLGVYNWPRTFPESCSGQHQSPVDIDTNRVRYGIECPCPRMVYRSPILSGEFKNNGHSASFEPESPMDFQIMDAPQRPGTYYLNDFHVHFGGVTGRSFELQGMRFRGSGVMSAGSEHTIDGLRFEGELHFVFYNGKYGGLQAAEDKPDGIVVITLLVQKLPGTMANSGETSEFSRFLEENVPRVQAYQQNASIEVDLRIFFSRRCDFYTYGGSITTPTCHESVRWVIMRDPIIVTERAWFLLTGLQSRGDFNSQFGNYRTTQPLNDRVIEANFLRTPEEGPVRPMPDGEPIRGPGMFMGMVRQPDIPMPGMGELSPMLNNNTRLMAAVVMEGNRSPMLNRNPGLIPPMPSGGNQNPMLNGNPNLMPPLPSRSSMSMEGQMQGSLPMPGGKPMPGGSPISGVLMPGDAMATMPRGAPMSGKAPMTGGNPGLADVLMQSGSFMPIGVPMPVSGEMKGSEPRPGGALMPLNVESMSGGTKMPGGSRMPVGSPVPSELMPNSLPVSPMPGASAMLGGSVMPSAPVPSAGNRSPMLDGNPVLTPIMSVRLTSGEQFFMPVINQIFPSNNNNNNNDDEDNGNNANRNGNRSPILNGNTQMLQMPRAMPETGRLMNAGQMPLPNQGQQAKLDPPMGRTMGAGMPKRANEQTIMPQKPAMSTYSGVPQMGSGNPRKPIMGGQADGAGGMVKGGQNNERNQSMFMMVPMNMLRWWNMNQEQARRLESNFFKVW